MSGASQSLQLDSNVFVRGQADVHLIKSTNCVSGCNTMHEASQQHTSSKALGPASLLRSPFPITVNETT